MAESFKNSISAFNSFSSDVGNLSEISVSTVEDGRHEMRNIAVFDLLEVLRSSKQKLFQIQVFVEPQFLAYLN